MRTIAVITLMLIGASAVAGELPAPREVVVDNKPIVVPVQPGSTVRPLGSGAIVDIPGRPDSTVRPLGSGVLIKTPGQADVRCAPLGSRTVCR